MGLARQQQAMVQNQQSNNGFQQAQLQNQNVASQQLNQYQAYQNERQANNGQGNQIIQETGSINRFDPAAQQQDTNVGQISANQVPVGHIPPNVVVQGQKHNYPGQHEPQLPVLSNGQVQQQAPSQQQPHVLQQNVVQLPSFQKQVFNSQPTVSENMKDLHENAARKSKLQAKQP